METLNHTQRAILLAAQARRMKQAKLARLQAAVVVAAAPDYFTYQTGRQRREHARRFAADLRAWCTHGQRRDGCDPREDRRGLFC